MGSELEHSYLMGDHIMLSSLLIFFKFGGLAIKLLFSLLLILEVISDNPSD